VSAKERAGRVALVLVAAVAENGVIGQGGSLPWRLKSDMKHFRAATMGRPVVMGRKTYLSIGKPLAGRTNIVVSRDRAFAAPGMVVVPGIDAALAVARGDALRRGAAEIAVIGGAEVYAQTIDIADRLVVTQVALQPKGDTTFPAIDPAAWRESERNVQAAGPEDEAARMRGEARTCGERVVRGGTEFKAVRRRAACGATACLSRVVTEWRLPYNPCKL
jgi:dihydrofolate reductase